MVQAPGGGGTDVHARAEAHGFQPFQYSYILRAVIALAIFFCMAGLDFMNFFRHKTLLDKKNAGAIESVLPQMVRCHFITIIYIHYSINEGFLQGRDCSRRLPW